MLRRVLLALVSLAGASLFSGHSHAQSACPNIYYVPPPQQLVLTAAQWNQCFQAKQDNLNYVPLNRAGGSMTGRLVLAPSTTSLAGLNIQPGVAPASPVDGDTWVTTSGLFMRINGTTVGPFIAGNFVANMPAIGAPGGNGLASGTKSGLTTEFATVSGALTPGNYVSTGANGDLIDGGAPCCASGSVGSGAQYSIGYYPNVGTNAQVGPLATSANSALIANGSGIPSFSQILPLAVQANLTEVGTVGIGVWQGSAVASSYGGTGVAAPTAHSVPIAEGSSPFAFLSPAGAGRLFVDQGPGNDPQLVACGGDCSSVSAGGSFTMGKLNGVAYGTAPAINTVAVATGTNAMTYELLPGASLASGAVVANLGFTPANAASLPTPAANSLWGWNSGPSPISVPSPPAAQVFTGNGVTTAFTLSGSLTTFIQLAIDINGVKQKLTTDYSVSGTTLTFTFAPPNNAVISVVSLI